MIINQKKLERQLIGVRKFEEVGGKGTLQWATAMGKTFTGILIIKRLRETNPHRKVIVVVPKINLKEQWEKKLREDNISNVDVYVINTITINQLNLECSLLILDEIHRYGGDPEVADINSFVKVFDYIKYRFILGLSATVERMDGLHQIIMDKAPIIDTITMEEAMKEGFISKFIEINLGIPLKSYEKVSYDYINEKFNKAFAWFGRDFSLVRKCFGGADILISPEQVVNVSSSPIGVNPDYVVKTRKGEYIRKNARGQLFYRCNFAKIHADNIGRTAEEIQSQAAIWNQYMRKRMTFLYDNDSKLDVAEKIIKALRLKTITFGESTSFADKLAALFLGKAVSYHSKKTTKENKNALNKFLNDEVEIMAAAKALDDGLDCNNIHLAIACSFSSNPTQNVQRRGRAVRLLDDPEQTKFAIFINLCIMNTQDEKWLKKCQKGRDNIQWLYSVESLLSFLHLNYGVEVYENAN